MKSRKCLVFALLVACGTVLTACNKTDEVPEVAAPRITGETITFPADSLAFKGIVVDRVREPTEREVTLRGRLVWDEERTVRVFTPFAGRVGRIASQVGDRVTAGQVLAELASPEFGSAQSDARRAAADVAQARKNVERSREMQANGITAAKDLQQAETDFARAEAEAERAQGRLKLYGASTRTVDQKYPLKSPIAGTIVERNINPGQELRPDQPGAPQFVVTDPTSLWLLLDANESVLQYLKPGAAIVVLSSQYRDDSFAGDIRQVADFVDPVTRTVKVRAYVPNRDRRLKAEMFVSARVALPKGIDPVVPARAVFLIGNRHFVFVRGADGSFVRRAVTAGAEFDDAIAVSKGLKVGEEVVVTGNLFIQQLFATQRQTKDLGKDDVQNAAGKSAPVKSLVSPAAPADNKK